MPDILHRISIDAAPKRVHDLVASTDGIARWWSGRPVTGEHLVGSTFSVYFADLERPSAVMRVVTDTPDEVVWQVTEGPDSWIGTRVIFAIRADGGGTTLLFTHAGWREAGEFMSGCSTNWGSYLTSLKTGAETGAFAAYPAGEVSRWNPDQIKRTYAAPPALVWEMLTTAAGLDEWFAPDGFETRVSEVDLRPGGELRYTMTATAPETIEFLRENGSPVSNGFRKTFTEVVPQARLAYRMVVDFVPGHDPYEHRTTIDIEPAGDRTTVVMTLDRLHDDAWTRQHRAHRGNELDNLGAAIQRRKVGSPA